MIGAVPLLAPVQRARARIFQRAAGKPYDAPEAQPPYARPVLLVILAVAALLFTWDIQHSGLHSFYSETVRSMSRSWKGFVFGSFDPGNTITMDKLPGFMWPQALSVRIFGFHGWAIVLPQVIEGILSVYVLFRAVRRWAGVNAALLAAAAFTLTPAIAGLYRTEVEDPAFTLCVLLAADATLRAARNARLRPLLAAGAWVGVSFQAKMLEAWAVLPALAVLYGLAAPTPLRRKVTHLAAAGALCVAVSASWVMLVAVTPAKDRPFIDGTTDNSAVSQVVGYNFLNRFSSLGISAKSTGSVAATTMVGTAPSPHAGAGQTTKEWQKMFGKSLASQVGWLYPAAGLSAVGGLLLRRGRPRADPVRAGFLMWTTWLATYFVVFSAGSVGAHTYYMGVVAVPMAALFGGGMVQLWRAWRAGGRAGTWALPAVTVTTVAWGVAVNSQFPTFLPWLTPTVVVLALGALGLLFGSRRAAEGPNRRRTAVLGLGAAVLAMMLPSAAWASSVMDSRYGHSGMGAAGPVYGAAARHKTPADKGQDTVTSTPGAGAHAGTPAKPAAPHPARNWRIGDALTAQQLSLLAYTRAHQDGATFQFATMNWRSASPFILNSNAKVLSLGGFTGAAPSPTLKEFKQLVADGRLRYVLPSGTLSSPAASIQPWVEAHCKLTHYHPSQLYLCTPAATR